MFTGLEYCWRIDAADSAEARELVGRVLLDHHDPAGEGGIGGEVAGHGRADHGAARDHDVSVAGRSAGVLEYPTWRVTSMILGTGARQVARRACQVYSDASGGCSPSGG